MRVSAKIKRHVLRRCFLIQLGRMHHQDLAGILRHIRQCLIQVMATIIERIVNAAYPDAFTAAPDLDRFVNKQV